MFCVKKDFLFFYYCDLLICFVAGMFVDEILFNGLFKDGDVVGGV